MMLLDLPDKELIERLDAALRDAPKVVHRCDDRPRSHIPAADMAARSIARERIKVIAEDSYITVTEASAIIDKYLAENGHPPRWDAITVSYTRESTTTIALHWLVIVDLVAAGASLRSVCRQFHCHPDTLRKHLHKAGIIYPAVFAKKVPVRGISDDNSIVCQFPSISDAVRIGGYDGSKISHCIAGRQQKHKNLRWERVTEDSAISPSCSTNQEEQQ